MTDKFTIVLEYDRDEILSDVQKFVDADSTLPRARDYLNSIYPAWSRDMRTSIMVALMFRDANDSLRPLYETKLAELNEKEGVTG